MIPQIEQTIIVTISFKLINNKEYFITKNVFNERLHLITKELNNGYMVYNYMMAMTHQYIEKTLNVETSIKWAVNKLISIYDHVEITKTAVKYVKKFNPENPF